LEIKPDYSNVSAQFNVSIQEYLKNLTIEMKGNLGKMDTSEPLFSNPYYWAAFTFTGLAP
jgi:CHAT domain-containing protein